jgi:hypothetical protein
MKRLGQLGRGIALAAAALIGSASTASAAPMLFTLQGANDSSLTASVLFTYVGLTSTTGRVDVAVTNTSANYDPRITGFAFNLPTAISSITSLSSSLSGWHSVLSLNGIDTPGQFGFYDASAQTGSTFNGGSPNSGIARGVTGLFSFGMTGTGMLGLTETSFLNLLAYDPPGGPNEAEQYFIARYQRTGVTGGGSDVAIPSTPPSSVPEPTTLLLTGLGLLGLTGLRRRKA